MMPRAGLQASGLSRGAGGHRCRRPQGSARIPPHSPTSDYEIRLPYPEERRQVILGIGIDQVQAARIASLIERFGERGERRLFTDRELARCTDRPRPEECLAARFAAKEAFAKALGTGLRGMEWTDIEVEGGEGERPEITLHGSALEAFTRRGGEHLHVSLTHEAGIATAVVVLEGQRI